MNGHMEAIFRKYQGNGTNCWQGTDKGSAHSYVEVYSRLFEPKRHEPVRLLEIGICSGASIVAWGEYFTNPSSEIIGIDVSMDAICYRADNDPRIKMLQMDGTDARTVAELAGTYDIIIDDGSHLPQHQAVSLGLFAPYLKNNGLYVIEDVLEIQNAYIIKQYGEQNLGLKGEVLDRRHIKGDPYDVMIVFTKNE